MKTLGDFSPLVEPLSLDEAFVDMTGAQLLFGSPQAIGTRIKSAIAAATGGLTASVGVSATRYVAKVASGYRKPDGLTIVPPDEARRWLAPLPVSSLWGAGAKTVDRLHSLGLRTVGDVAVADAAALEQKLGSVGRRFHALANALDPREVVAARAAASVGSERTLDVDVADSHAILAHLRVSADEVAKRLRRRSLVARGVRIKLKRTDFRILTRQGALPAETDVGADLYALAEQLLKDLVVAETGPFRLVGLACYGLTSRSTAGGQLDLGDERRARTRRLETTIDRLAERFGAGIVKRAGELSANLGVGPTANLDFLSDD
jgi:DNA polymerase-4